MAKKQKTQFQHHKGYRWIALFAKILAGVIFPYLFANLTMPMLYTNTPQTVGTFLSTTLTLVVYYGIIFLLNRYRNFEERPPLGKTIAVYTLVVLLLMALETAYAGVIQNFFYKVTNLGYSGDTINIMTVNNRLVYSLLGAGVHFVFGYITGIVLFVLFKRVLSNEEKLAKI